MARMWLLVVFAVASLGFQETFQDEMWSSRWIASEAEEFTGEWRVGAGLLDWGKEGELGLIVGSEAKRHAISTTFNEAIRFDEHDLVVQYEVRLHNKHECGGAYLKLLRDTGSFDQSTFNDKSDYVIMFGPDKCGSTNKVHFIFKHQNPVTSEFVEHHLVSPPPMRQDQLTHLYTLVVRQDNSFEILIDMEPVSRGSLLEDFEPPVNPPKKIDDPTDEKPADWVDDEMMPDPEDKKPEDWDESAPAMIPDPNAEKPGDWDESAPLEIPDPEADKPDDWDDELDGDWEAPLVDNPACADGQCGPWSPPMIANPDFKGKWTPKLIPNPEYKGEWTPRQIDNPDYFEDLEPHKLSPIIGIGFDLWTLQDEIQFDNVFLGYDKEAADAFAAETWAPKHAIESAMHSEQLKAQDDAAQGSTLQQYLEFAVLFTEENPVAVFISVAIGLVTIFAVFVSRRSSNSAETKDAKQIDKDSKNKNEDQSDTSSASDDAE